VKREHLEHILRASAEICGENEFCVIGSQAILGEYPEIDDEIIVRSMECDLYPERVPEKSELLNSIGELSEFHREFGYYADGVGPDTAVLPKSWQSRRSVIEIRTIRDARVLGWCLETHDLLISKYAAGRPKDLNYCAAAIRLGIVSREILRDRLKATTMATHRRRRVLVQIEADFSEAPGNLGTP